jgi:hypothetical protein
MTKYLVPLVLAAVTSASANIELFWSSTGINDPALRYSTAATNFLPAFVPPTPVIQVAPGTYDLFLWGRFNEDADLPSYTQIYGLDLKWGAMSGVTIGPNVAYRHYFPEYSRRWDGSHGILLDGVMAAVTARGIMFILPPDTNNDLYYPATHEFLIGAVQATFLQPWPTLTIELDATPPGLGIAMRHIGDGDIPDPAVLPATLPVFPEPGGEMLLTLLAAFGMRARRGPGL